MSFCLNSQLLYWLLSEGIEMVSYFYNWYKNQHIFSQPRFSVYDNLSCFVVAENLCVLAHSKILSFKAIVACLRSFRPCRLDYQHRPDSRKRRKTSQVLPWIEYTTQLNHLNYFEGATHLSLLFILKWSLQYIHKRNRIRFSHRELFKLKELGSQVDWGCGWFSLFDHYSNANLCRVALSPHKSKQRANLLRTC